MSRFEMVRLMILVFALAIVATMNTGCSSLGKKLKGFLNGSNAEEKVATAPRTSVTPRFSEQENLRYNGAPRQYRRMNRQRFEEDAEVRSNAGSLWVMEGQGAYLVSQNNQHLVGDMLNVKIEGTPKSQLTTKVKVISKLLDKLDHPDPPRLPAHQNGQAAPAAATAGQPPAPGAPGAAAAAATPAPQATPEPAKAEAQFNVQAVPTRIVEMLKDGSYRVKGSQAFMIGKREYKVIVTGIVRPEDFNTDDGTNSSKLLDSQFDVVSTRKAATSL